MADRNNKFVKKGSPAKLDKKLETYINDLEHRIYNLSDALNSRIVQILNTSEDSDTLILYPGKHNAARNSSIIIAAASDGPVRLPAGDYYLEPQVTLPAGASLIGQGTGNTVLTFLNPDGRNGFIFDSAASNGLQGNISSMTIGVCESNGGACIKTAFDERQYFDFQTRYSFRDLEFKGDYKVIRESGWQYDFGWTYYIDLADCWGAYISDIDAIGVHDIAFDPVGQPEHTFLRLQAAGGILTARISNISVASVYNGIEIGTRAFFMMEGLDLIQMHRGIYSTGGSLSTTFSEGRISDSLINAQLVCLHLYNSSWRAISNVAMGRHRVGYDHGDDWIGLHMQSMTKCWVSNMRSQTDTSVTNWTGTQYGYKFEDCAGFTIAGLISGLGLDYGVHCDEVVQAEFVGCNFQGTSGVGFRFENLSRDISIPHATFSSGWTHFEFESGIDLSKYQIPQRHVHYETGQPYIFLRESDEGTDEKNWRTIASNGTLSHQVVSDDESSSFSYDVTTRNGSTIGTPTTRELRATTIQLSGVTSHAGDARPSNDNSRDLGTSSLRYRDFYAVRHFVGSGAAFWSSGTGTPEGVVTAPVGSIFSRLNGGAGSTLYVKESGTGNTGWVAK